MRTRARALALAFACVLSAAGCYGANPGLDASRYWREGRVPSASGADAPASPGARAGAVGCEGWRIHYVTGESALDARLEVTASCRHGQATLEVVDSSDRPSDDCMDGNGECAEWGAETRRIELTRGEWAALWESVRASGWRTVEDCTPAIEAGVPSHSLTVTTPADSRTLSCRRDPLPPGYARVVESLSPPPEPEWDGSDESIWPFDAEYWRDELRYYSRR